MTEAATKAKPVAGPSPVAAVRIAEAAKRLQLAQNEVGRALEELSQLRYIGLTYRHTQKAYLAVKNAWYRVDELRRSPVTTDSEPE